MSGLNKNGMMLAKEFEGELWIKAADHDRAVKQAVEAEREACAALCDDLDDYIVDGLAGWQYGEAIRARGQE